jgi:hypothetical protein
MSLPKKSVFLHRIVLSPLVLMASPQMAVKIPPALRITIHPSVDGFMTKMHRIIIGIVYFQPTSCYVRGPVETKL